MNQQLNNSDPLRTKLNDVWRRQRLSAHLSGITWAVVLTLSLMTSLFFVDWMLKLPRYARWFFLASSIAVLVWQLKKNWFTKLQTFNELRLATLVEEHFPKLNSLLVSYVELTKPTPAATGSPELFGLVKKQAIEATRPLDFLKTVDLSKLKPMMRWAGLAIFIFIIICFLCGNALGIAFQRYLGSNINYPTQTQITSFPDDRTVAEGELLTLSFHVEGKVPPKGTIFVRSKDSDSWRSIELQPTVPGQFNYEIKNIEESFEYVFEIGDTYAHTRHDPGEITVVSPPKLVSQTLKVAPPAYTGLKPYEVNSLTATVPAGAQLAWSATMSEPVSEASLMGPNDFKIDGVLSAGKSEASFSWKADTAGQYFLESTSEAMGLTSKSLDHRLKIREDREPRATLRSPQGNVKATANKKLKLTVQASDDYGLQEFAIIYRLNGSESEQRISLGAPPANDSQQDLKLPRSGTWPLEWNISSDIPNIKAGDLLEVSVEVTEVAADPSSARKAVTQACEVEILSITDYQSFITSRFDALRSDISETEQREGQIKRAIEKSKDKLAKP